MSNDYRRPSGYHEVELEIKRSRFIAIIQPIDSVDDAKQQLQQLRQLHPHANHHCWARIAGQPSNAHLWDCSDDGEPKGTAGRPMLQVLTHSDLGQIQAIVVRYFGGIKLGTGGLVRAYGQAVNEALHTLETEWVIARQQVVVTAPHHLTGELEQLLRQHKIPADERDWQEQFTISSQLTQAELENLTQQLQRFGGEITHKVID